MNLLPLYGIELLVLERPVRRLFTTPTALFQILLQYTSLTIIQISLRLFSWSYTNDVPFLPFRESSAYTRVWYYKQNNLHCCATSAAY